MLKLYTYHQSVAAHRVRIALNFKGAPFQSIFIDMEHSEHQGEDYRRLNPEGLVPALVANDDLIITQSSAILEYIEERYPERPLLPAGDLELRSRIRSFSQVLIADMQPMNVMRVYKYMQDVMGVDYDKRRGWYEHWMNEGFKAIESLLVNKDDTGAYCFGDRPTLADVCLVPQVWNASKYGIDLSPYPMIRQIYRMCQTLSAFQAAAPETQGDHLAQAI